MADTAKFPSRKLENFLSRLSDLVDNLPSQETKAQIDRELEALINFLKDFQSRFQSLPTLEDSDSVTSTIETLKNYVRVAESDPLMSHVLGLSSNKAVSKRSSRGALTEHERREAKTMVEELKRLPYEETERKLADRKYTVAMLRQIGEELGLKLPSKSTRLSIVEKITKQMDNLRGYDYLRRGGD